MHSRSPKIRIPGLPVRPSNCRIRHQQSSDSCKPGASCPTSCSLVFRSPAPGPRIDSFGRDMGKQPARHSGSDLSRLLLSSSGPRVSSASRRVSERPHLRNVLLDRCQLTQGLPSRRGRMTLTGKGQGSDTLVTPSIRDPKQPPHPNSRVAESAASQNASCAIF